MALEDLQLNDESSFEMIVRKCNLKYDDGCEKDTNKNYNYFKDKKFITNIWSK